MIVIVGILKDTVIVVTMPKLRCKCRDQLRSNITKTVLRSIVWMRRSTSAYRSSVKCWLPGTGTQ